MTWVSWKKCLASKKSGGLGIGSIYGLNVGLLFKWIWRFLQNAPDLWINIIKAIYGQHGGIFEGSTHRSSFSPWCGILSSIRSLNLKGIDLLALCIRKLGNGVSIRFWEDVWSGTLPLKSVYPVFSCLILIGIAMLQIVSLFLIGAKFLEGPQGVITMMLGIGLLISKGFFVASARSLVDSHILEVSPIATRWNGCIPIKVNIFLWKLLLNKLPSRVNLDRRGIDIPSILCPNCQEDVETVNHIFFTCEMASTLWSMLANWWEVDIPLCAIMEDWISWLETSHFSKKVRVVLDGVGGVLLWHIWNYRNGLVFSNPPPKKSFLWDKVVSQSFLWITSRNPNFKFSWVGWLWNPVASISFL
ncbi:RNA-directed DNA polymerase, eukaryota, reverse transcriptase zinc-binding domain protein [Tanacetum coccineum]